MTALTWFYLAAGGWVLAAAAAAAGSGRLQLRLSCALSALAGAAAVVGGVSSLWWGDSQVVTAGGTVVVAGSLQLQASSLAGIFAALLGLVAVAIAAYAPRYHEPGPATGAYLAVFNLSLLASLAVLAAANVVTFLVGRALRAGPLRIRGDAALPALPVPAGHPRRGMARRRGQPAPVRGRQPLPAQRVRGAPARLSARRALSARASTQPPNKPAGGAQTAPGCPADVPGLDLPDRIAHLYTCQGLSTYRIAGTVGISRQRVTRVLHKLGVPVKPKGAGRRRTAGPERFPGTLLADLYLRQRLSCAEISELTGIPARTIWGRLRAQGVRIRTRGRLNREDRLTVAPDLLAEMYLRAGLTSDEVGRLLGVSRRVVLRTAHDEGLPVRMGGAQPGRGPAEIELINALYADPQVRQTLAGYGIARVPPGGPIWERFPEPVPLSSELAEDLYVTCGLATTHIELLTGRPADSVRKVLRAAGVALRPAGGRSPFLRQWRALGRTAAKRSREDRRPGSGRPAGIAGFGRCSAGG